MASGYASPVLSLPAPESDQGSHSSPNPTTLMSLPKRAKPWTPLETLNLIHAYKEKWYSLNRGHFKASQWEEVAVTVAARCGFDDPSKSATQCRHKIEKLRKRYRAERVKPNPDSWQYFELMDGIERGTLPIAAHPVAMVKYQNSNSNNTSNRYNQNSDSEEVNVSYEDTDFKKNKSMSINHNVRGELDVNTMAMRSSMNGKRKGYFTTEHSEDEEEDEELDGDNDEEEDEIGDGGSDLAMEIRDFSQRFFRMEKKKIEMMKETEKCRMEMEKKKMKTILEAQRKIIDTVSRAFGQEF